MATASTEFALRGPLLILGAAVLWGTTGTAQALGSEAARPLQVGGLRLVVAALALAAVARALPIRPRPPGESDRSAPGVVRRPATLVAALAIAAYQPFFFVGVDQVGVAIGTLIALGSAPVFAGLLQFTVERVAPTRRWLLASLAAIVGLVLLNGASAGTVAGLGAVAALGAGFSYAGFASAMGRLRTVDPGRSLPVIFGLAAVLDLPLVASGGLEWLGTARGWVSIGWLGLAATTLAYILFERGLQTTDVNRAATLSLAEPITATLLGVVVVGESIGGRAWAGIALMAVALAALVRGR